MNAQIAHGRVGDVLTGAARGPEGKHLNARASTQPTRVDSPAMGGKRARGEVLVIRTESRTWTRQNPGKGARGKVA